MTKPNRFIILNLLGFVKKISPVTSGKTVFRENVIHPRLDFLGGFAAGLNKLADENLLR